jgi:hypothetical protein
MKFRYVGPFEGVEIPALGVVVDYGHEIEVTGDVAQEFAKRDDWTRTDSPKAKAPPPEEPALTPEPAAPEAASSVEGGEV